MYPVSWTHIKSRGSFVLIILTIQHGSGTLDIEEVDKGTYEEGCKDCSDTCEGWDILNDSTSYKE